MNRQEFARTVLDVNLTDYQREMLENIPETIVPPAGIPSWSRARLPFIPAVMNLLIAGYEAYEKSLRIATGPTTDVKDQGC